MRRKWLATITVLTAVAIIIGYYPMSAGAAERYEEKFEKTVALSKTGKVVLSNVSGSVLIKTWDKAEVQIDALKVSKHSSKDKAKEYASKVTIEIEKDGDILTIKTKYPKPSIKKLNVSITYKLMIPNKADLDAGTVSGSVEAYKTGGSTKVHTVSGKVRVEDVAGVLRASTTSGTVSIARAAKGAKAHTVSGTLTIEDVDGDVDADCTSGRIRISNVKGSVMAKTVSGGITMENIEGAKVVKASVLSGNVKYEGDILSDGTYSFKSHSGTITLTIPADSAFDLDAKTFSGSISSDFEITMSGKISKKRIRGSVNGGGAELEVNTFSGSVRLKKK